MAAVVFVAAMTVALQEQETVERVRALLEKLNDDNVAAREAASQELVRLGTAAVPILRERLSSASVEVRARLEEILRRIDRAAKLAKVFRPTGIAITMRDAPVIDILAEMSRQSGIPLEVRDLPQGQRASLDARGVSIWTALDRLCRDHPDLMYTLSPRQVLLRPGPYRPVPRFEQGPFLLVFDRAEWQEPPAEHREHSPTFTLYGGIALPALEQVQWVRFIIEEAVDDQGRDLVRRRNASLDEVAYPSGSRRQTGIALPLLARLTAVPDPGAARLARVRGCLVVRYVLETRLKLAVKRPDSAPVSTDPEELMVLKATSWSEKEGSFKLGFELDAKPSPQVAFGLNQFGLDFWLVLRDAQGRKIPADVLGGGGWGGGRNARAHWRGWVKGTRLKGVEIGTLELVEAADTEEVSIPFELKDIPLK